MQLKVARLLNQILMAMAAVVLLLAGGYFVVARQFEAYRRPYIIGAAVVSIALYLGFRWLENRWDKRVITKMAKDGCIALAHIKGGRRAMRMRDSAFVNYWLYEFDAQLITPDQKVLQKTFYEKMRYDTDDIPQGFVYVTYDENRPDQVFIVPNILIGHLPELMPTIAKYEQNKGLNIKYLDAFYSKGMVLRTYRETVKASQAARDAT